jgi:hypothetical protein
MAESTYVAILFGPGGALIETCAAFDAGMAR